MFNFDFMNPTHIIFGKDRFEELDKVVPTDVKVMITYGGQSAVKNGLIEKAKKVLAPREIVEFGGIEPNPQFETLMKAVRLGKSQSIDFILAIGGGSVIDGTKFIAAAMNAKTDDYKGLLLKGFAPIPPEVLKESMPFGTILTLAATGSEMNTGAVISDGHDKYPFMFPRNYPKFSLLDPSITFTVPSKQIANGIVDAFIHTTEQYITFPVNAKIQDRWAEGILQTLVEIGQTCMEEPDNYDARANHMWAATMALNGIIGLGVPQDWATHMIGHELTGLFGIDHGRTLAIVYPGVLRYMKEEKKAKLVQYAERVWDIKEGSDDEKAELAIVKTEEFFKSLGVDIKLSDYGVKEEQIEDVVKQLTAHGMMKLSETGQITPEIAGDILKSVF